MVRPWVRRCCKHRSYPTEQIRVPTVRKRPASTGATGMGAAQACPRMTRLAPVQQLDLALAGGLFQGLIREAP